MKLEKRFGILSYW